MRRFLLSTLITLSLAIGATGAAPVAHAATEGSICDFTNPDTQDGIIQNGKCVSNGTYGFKNTSDDIKANITANKAADAAAANTKTDFATDGKENAAYNSVMQYIMILFAWLVGVAAITLDNAVFYTVVTMGDYVKNLSAVGVAWRILRDVGNITLIFGFLAIGISIILNTERMGWGKKMLPMLLISAVFLNFSLFFAEVVIDSGNLFATQFYTQINGGQPAGAKNYSFAEVGNEGISNKIMAQLGLQTLYGKARTNTDVFKGANSWVIGFMGILLFIVTAFVMFSLAFILIARFIYLIYLIILAPVGFAGLAIPQLKGRADEWWAALFKQTITAPVLMLMLYIALAVITDVHFLTGFGSNPDWWGFVSTTNGQSNLTGFAGTILSFLVAMGLLMAVTIFASKLSAFGAGWATKTAGKLSFGVAAWGVNRTVGRAAYHAARAGYQSKTLNKIDAVTGRVISGTLNRAAKASFDVRGATIGGGLKGLSVEAGEASKDGFAGARSRNIKEHEENAKRIETAHKDAIWDTEEDEKKIKETKAERERAGSGQKQTQKEFYEAQDEVKAREKEYKRLSDIDRADRDARRPSSVSRELAVAKSNLETSQKKQEMLRDSLGKLEDVMKNLKKAEEDAAKAAEKRMKESMEKAKLAYAEGIDHPVWNIMPISPNLYSYGPGTMTAVRNIRKSIKEKPDKDKLADLVKKMTKEGEEKPEEEPAEGAKPAEPAH